MEKRPKKLLDRAREILRLKHYSIRKDIGMPEIKMFLSHLAIEKNVVGSTQNQALSMAFLISLTQFFRL